MKKKFVRLISAVLSAAMTLTAVPLSAFAEGEAHTHDGESNVITTPLDFREKTADENGDGWSWDHDTKTLTLNGVNIQATTEENMMSVVTVPDGTEIVLNGNNTIVQTDTGKSDTYVLSAVNNKEVNCDGTMTISGDGVLNAENRSTDSMARSLGGSIILNGGTVNATGTVKTNSLEIHNDGVLNANATTASFEGVAVNVSRGITVDGNGSLTAVGCANESTLNSAILLTSNFGDKISVSENGSITVPEGNAARVGIYYSGNNGDGMDAEISGGKVTAYGAKYGIYKVNLIMSGTGSVYTTGGSYAIGQTVPTIDEDEFVVKGSTESKASESAVTGEVKLNGGYYEIDGADAKTVVIKPDTSPRIILGKQTGIFKTEEYEIIEGMDMTDTKLKGTVYFDITLKNMSDEEFADARGCFGGDEPDLSASIIKTDYGWVCMVYDTEFSTTYDTDNTLTIKCGDIVSNTVQVKSNANRFNKVTQGDNTNRTVFYTNTSQEEKDNYKLVSTYTVDSESISYNWYSTNSAYSADELGAAVSGSNGEFKLADNIPAGNYVLYCDITYSDGDSTETVTEKFTFTYKECAHENGYSDGKCTNCGALCDHSDIDIGMGKCNKCERQFVATISTDGSAPTGYDTLADCLDSITADTGNYVKIYQDIGDASATAILDTIDVKHNVMIDLNGHKLNNIKLGVNKLGVNKDVTLTLTGTAGSYVTQVYVRKGGGSFIIDSEANVEFNTIFVEDSARLAVNDGAKVTTEQLTVIASVNDDGTTTTSVKLATGMKLGGLTYHRQNNSGALKLGNLLDVTRQALRREDNGNYLDLYKEYGSMGYSVALTVVEHTDADHKYGSGTGKCEECGKPCEHGGDINTDTGICSICGAVVSVALYTDKNGSLKYVDTDELHSLLNEYNGSGTIKLFKDYSKPSAQYDLYGELTIDVNGRQFKIRSITPCKSGKLTIKNSGNPVMLGCNVYPTNDASYAGGTLIIDGDVVLDTSIYVYDSSTVILKDGTYTAGLYARDSKTLYDMLGEGKAFFKADGTLFNANVKEISSSETLTIKDHSHTYVDGECGCGYVCPHSDVNSETGKCNECEYQYAAVIVKDGAAASVYKETEMEAAFEAADSDANTGCTLKVYKNYTGIYTTLSGKFTLWIAEKANVGTLTVSGDITVTGSEKNNSIYGDFNVVDGGKLTFDEKCGAMGTVSVGAGTFDCYSTFGITLNINDASSDVILHGGAFRKICYNGGGDRANAEILTLLAENRIFTRTYGELIDGSKTLLKDGFATTVIVIRHEDHSYDSTTGKCTICGKRCGHTDVDSKTGVCLTCEYQFTAGISGVGTAKYFDNIDNAFTAASSAENSGCTLTLYKDCELSQNIVIGNATLTVDVNGHFISPEIRGIDVNDGGVLYLKNSGENGSIGLEMAVNKGGTLINGTADDSSSAVSLFAVTADAAECVEFYGGSCTYLTIKNGTSGIALYGGYYDIICGSLTDNTPVNDLLAKGYAFATLNSVTHLPESIVDGSAKTIGEGIRKVTVVKHTHTYTETNTKCACGAVLYAKVTSADGTTNEYFDSIEEGLLYADKAENKGCVFTLVTSGKLEDGVKLSSGKFTITANDYVTIYKSSDGRGIIIEGADVIAEGHMSINCHMFVNSGSLTLPEGSSTRFGDIIYISGGTVNISEGVNADNNAGADNLIIANDATDAKVTIGGGAYGRIVLGQHKFKDVLVSGVRVIRYDNSSDSTAEKTATALLYSEIAEESSLAYSDGRYYLVTKCDHKNEDGSYAFNEGGICKYCNSEFAASVSYTDGSAKTELFSDICDAFDKANGVGTATITLCRDIADSEIAHEINVTGNVTLALNGKTLGATDKANKIYICGSTLTVNGNGKVWSTIEAKPDSKLTITNGEYNDVDALSDSEVVILDGIIDCLNVYGTGKPEVSGGKFKYLFMYNNKAIESVLADGYAYKNADGTWLSIDKREENSYLGGSNGALSVEEAPIKSASIAWYGGGTPVIYRNGAKNLDVNITYELADASKQITYSDYVNGNNHSKDSEFSDNWYTVFGYEIGDIITEDGEVEYYTVLKCDGYEYKSNVLKLTLATCSHPEDSFTEKNNDGGVFCGICDLLIGAQVIKADGEPLGYADIESAIKLAQENEGSTVKLISEGVSTSNTSITVTGGKFTVDFNGKEVYYNSDVKGGDVTFTSSTEQADAKNLLSTIKVNGADAKVTIDGKIKLGMVRTFSGTLTVNSTDGYIGELSIEGAKTDVDGARIGALRTFGGEAVIKNVTADSLAMFDNRSGGSEYNISIVSGMFGSFTCENGSNYTLGRAIASGSVVSADSMNGITVYTYEAIQTMTSTYRIFVDKCNHKDKNGSYVLDGNPCPYCNEEIVATVSYTAGGSEETDLFSDIYDAFDKANEIGTATVTLQKNITDDITDTIAVTGNVTLELNGKRLSQPGTDVWYSIEVTSGKLTVNGSGLIKRVAVCNGSNAEINGGTFSDFIIKDGGNAVINGGKFNSIKVSGEGRNVGQLLADGYAYWSLNKTGYWSTIAEREKQDIANVEVKEAPIKSATITAEDESPIIYRNSKKASTFAADVTYSGNETLYVTIRLIDGTVIREKTELLNGYCSLFSSEVDKAVAEDGEIQYYCIFTYDGYDYKSNAVTLTVATCRHPVESVKCDDNGCVCGICDSMLLASVELSDGTLSYYNNWNDAIGAAEESEGCTLKLLSYDWVKFGEIFDISKGRFTVDLNKNDGTTTFAFNVKGGDITFTASQAASSSFTCVTVSGENANVLIDSKATLNSLVVNSGKVSADGANIGAITINGGDTVINDVNADYLSMKADTTGGSGYNVSIVSGTFNIFTCENESNYTLGRAIASGSRVIGLNAIVGSGFKYAEIQSMTKANYLNVIKCDHKDENDSYALDGNLCPYCNEEIAATVSYTTANGGEMTDLFSDIYDAFERANERGTATITLYKDIENSELTRYITVTGNVTLALNGKKLGYSFVSLTIVVSDGGMLTVDGDGKMMVPIIVNENAKLTVNGGEIATVMIYKDGDAVIGGGFIEDLVVNGNAKLSGGKFYNLEIANGSLESILADGYAYKKDGGAWLSIAERAKEKYYSWNNEDKPVSVEEAPIKSATLSTEINQLYRNSNANPTLKFNLALAHGSNLNDSYVSKRYGINSYVSGDIIYSSLSALVKDAKLSADEIIDKAGDSDVAEIYFVVTTGDGYEIKSNAVSIDLVDCDHSQVVDPTADKETAGNITEPTYCEICESKFNAKITKGDDVRYYNDLDEAAKDAQKSENEGCTLYPLYNKNGYGGQLVITEGNFTLKYAVRTAFSRPIIINGKAKLTVTGRCAVTAFENQDAFIVQGGDVTFDGLATGSNVTINGGNVTMTANNINCLTINGGNVSISSGGFAEIITNVGNKVIADYIDPGFWVQDRGTKEWIDIYSLNKATASSTNGLTVRLCPMQIIKPIDTVYYTNGYYPDDIPSLQISAVPWYSGEVDAKVAYQWIAIDENGYETVIEGATDRKLSLENLTTGRYYCRLTYSNATTAGVSMKSDVVTATITECEHSGGEATCTEKAKCEICGAEYGEMKPHSYAHIKAYEYLKSAATCTAKAVYYTSCTECGRSSKGTADEATFEYGNALGHKYGEWVSNGDGTHTRVCANDNKHIETKACHGGKATCTAKAICEVCGKAYGEMKPHSYTNKKSPEYLKSAATCTAKAVYYTSCADCGLSSKGTADEATFEYGNALGHKYGEWVSNGDGTHSRVCANDSTHIETKNCHGGKATCTAKAICEVCGKAYGEMTAHTFTAKSAVSRYLKKAATCTEKSEYYVSCAGCGLSSKGTKSEATFEGSALGHLLTQWNVTDASCTESGSEERHCTRCDYKQTQIIPAKGHTFGEWKITKNVGCVTDGEQTRECTVCGSKETKVIAATGVHVYGGWKVTKAPTCTTAGVKERTCAGCNAKETMTLQATGHKYTTSTVKPTYSAKGYTLYKCSLCGKSYKCNYTNMLVLPSVSGLKATSRTDKSITLGWNRNANATGYVIEYYNGAKWVKKSTVTKNTTVKYTVSSLKPGTVNKFRIRAYKATNYSAYSYITVNTLPSAVSGFKTVSKTSSTSTLRWNKNTSADGYIIERYIVNRWIQTQKVVGSGNVSTTIKSLTAGSTNKLRIRAYKTINKKTEYSSYTYLNVKTKPARMTGLKAKSKTNNTVTLQWNKNATADSVFIEKYDGSKWVNVKKLSAGFTTYTVRKLSSGRTYRFRVRAYRAGEYSSYTYLNVNTRPYTTTGMKSKSVTKNSIVLQWNKNTSADGYSIEKYDGKKWVQVKRYTSNKSTTYTIKGLKARTTYKFRMRAYKTIGKVNEYSAYTYCNVTTAK